MDGFDRRDDPRPMLDARCVDREVAQNLARAALDGHDLVDQPPVSATVRDAVPLSVTSN